MSGIALVLHERGIQVTGSDLKASCYVRELSRAGIDVHVGYDPATIDEIKLDVVVISTAIPERNVELDRAHELGIPVWPCHHILPVLSAGYTTVAVSGTHGKTTTSSMVATMLDGMRSTPASSSAASSRASASPRAAARARISSPRLTSPMSRS